MHGNLPGKRPEECSSFMVKKNINKRIMMALNVSISFITGSAKVTKNHLFSDDIVWRKARTIKQMFFQPYESKEEYIYCARYTLQPMILIGISLIPPMSVFVPTLMLKLSVACSVLGVIISRNENGTNFFLDTAERFLSDICQMYINLLVLPLSLLIMLTRGISTGLEAAGKDWLHDAADSYQNNA